MKILLHYVFGKTQVNQVTCEPIHSAQAQNVRVTKNYILVLLVTMVATLQEVGIHFVFDVRSLYFELLVNIAR